MRKKRPQAWTGGGHHILEVNYSQVKESYLMIKFICHFVSSVKICQKSLSLNSHSSSHVHPKALLLLSFMLISFITSKAYYKNLKSRVPMSTSSSSCWTALKSIPLISSTPPPPCSFSISWRISSAYPASPTSDSAYGFFDKTLFDAFFYVLLRAFLSLERVERTLPMRAFISMSFSRRDASQTFSIWKWGERWS